jgi:hypothetical protein
MRVLLLIAGVAMMLISMVMLWFGFRRRFDHMRRRWAGENLPPWQPAC